MNATVNLPLMVIDDDDDLREVIVEIMMSQGYEVLQFADARAALSHLEGGSTPFLILLDLMMPRMSGWEFRAAQLKNPLLAPIPVVVITAASKLSDGFHVLSDVEILRKPFDLDSLLTVVTRYAAMGPGPR